MLFKRAISGIFYHGDDAFHRITQAHFIGVTIDFDRHSPSARTIHKWTGNSDLRQEENVPKILAQRARRRLWLTESLILMHKEDSLIRPYTAHPPSCSATWLTWRVARSDFK